MLFNQSSSKIEIYIYIFLWTVQGLRVNTRAPKFADAALQETEDERLPADAPNKSDDEDEEEEAPAAGEPKPALSADDQLALALLDTEQHAKEVRNRSSTSFQYGSVWGI